MNHIDAIKLVFLYSVIPINTFKCLMYQTMKFCHEIKVYVELMMLNIFQSKFILISMTILSIILVLIQIDCTLMITEIESSIDYNVMNSIQPLLLTLDNWLT